MIDFIQGGIMAEKFVLVMRTGPNAGVTYPLEGAEIYIGREAVNGVAINDTEVSRKHAKLSLHGSTYVIQDLGSTNGTFVNNERITGTQVLNTGDTVRLGENISLIYEASYDPGATIIAAQPPKTAVRVQKAVQAQPAAVPQAPTPGSSRQVPVIPLPAAEPAVKKGGKVVVLIILAIVVCLILACIALLVWVDADKTGLRWCLPPFNIIAKLLGGYCP
jgi:hypothetical protein